MGGDKVQGQGTAQGRNGSDMLPPQEAVNTISSLSKTLHHANGEWDGPRHAPTTKKHYTWDVGESVVRKRQPRHSLDQWKKYGLPVMAPPTTQRPSVSMTIRWGCSRFPLSQEGGGVGMHNQIALQALRAHQSSATRSTMSSICCRKAPEAFSAVRGDTLSPLQPTAHDYGRVGMRSWESAVAIRHSRARPGMLPR